jgi:hypothetical protein
MNCYKFARIKSGTVTAGFTVKLTESFGDQNSYTGSISKSSSLNLDLTYKDMCRIDRGVAVGKPWAIRGPECDKYHLYRGQIYEEGFITGLGTYTTGYPYNTSTYDIVLALQYNLFGCAYEDFSGRLNAYGRKAKKAKEEAPPPDPDDPPEPCPTQVGLYFLGVPPGTTDPGQTVEQNILIPFSTSQGLFAYGTADNEPFTATGTLALYYYYQPTDGGDGTGAYLYEMEVTGTRNINIIDHYGG